MCSWTPRFSYGVPETCVRVVTLAYMVCGAGWVPGWVYGGVWDGWVLGEGYTGYYPATQRRARNPRPDSGAGPVGPAGAGVGGQGWGGRVSPDHPCGARSVHPVALPVWVPAFAASWPIRRDYTSFPGNLVKTAKCRQKVSKRPLIVPIFKTASKSRLLKF